MHSTFRRTIEDRPIFDSRTKSLVRNKIVRSSDETFQRLLWLSQETEELAIQDSLCTDTRLQFTATSVTCKGLTVARTCPIIHGDRKLVSYSIYGKISRKYTEVDGSFIWWLLASTDKTLLATTSKRTLLLMSSSVRATFYALL